MWKLDELLRFLEAGGRLPGKPWYQVVAAPGTQLIMAFTGHTVIVTDLGEEWVAARLPHEDLSAPLCPPFLSAMEAATGKRVNNIDILTMAPPEPGEPDVELSVIEDSDHPRVRRAHRYRTDVTVYRAEGAVLIVGRGVGGRWEAAVEVDEGARGRGLGRVLAQAARRLVPEQRPIWAQIAPGNAASVRAFLAAGYVPVGAEALLVA
jgi:GNAT superfamily N-acetyltransferase